MSKTKERIDPHVNVRMRSPFQSSRNGQRIGLIVVHATAGHNRPGVVDLQSLGEWFQNPDAEVSSHVATDNEGHSARFVANGAKAWHCAAYNGQSLGIEQVMPGDGTEITEALYRETARWIARFSIQHDIPCHQGAVHGGVVTRRGVLRHSDLGVLGGNHDDPGRYDEAHLLELARHYRKLVLKRR